MFRPHGRNDHEVTAMTTIQGRSVLITGGSGGIGAEIARRLAARGWASMARLTSLADEPFPKLEHADLDRRLSRLEWPTPGPEVKQRGLAEIRRAMDAQPRDAPA
jgi:NAD(P)-dependent dehydrogenase (short-subunit alcohol dehydrogenase family)